MCAQSMHLSNWELHHMRTIYHRTKDVILVLVGTVALAAGPGVPIASALSNQGSVSPNQTRADTDQCQNYFDTYMAGFWQAMKHPGTPAGADGIGVMNHENQEAADRGCEWAQAYTVGTPKTGPIGV